MGVAEIIVGILAVLIGGLFCFGGNIMMRIFFPFIGFFTGFSAGAGMITAITGDGFLSTTLSWVVGLLVALLFAVLAYFFYAFSVVLAFAGLGFTLTSAVLSLIQLDWNWLVVLLGTAVGIVFGIIAIAMRLPLVTLAVGSAFLGSAVVIYGLMLMFNTAQLGDFSNGIVRQTLSDNIGLYIVWFMGGVMGSINQIASIGREQKLVQEYWDSSKTYSQLR